MTNYMIEIIKSTEVWTFLGVIATGVIGYFAGKRKSAAEAEGIEVDNDKEILNTYKAELEYFSKQLVATRKEISELREEVNQLVKMSCSNFDCKVRQK